jgi:hypothetical protein
MGWPLVTLELSGVADRAHSESLIETLSAQIARGRCAVVLDSRHVQLADHMTATQNIQREARWLRSNQALIASNVLAFALVLDGVAVRFLFSSLLSMASLKTRWLATTQLSEGVTFCSLALQQARVA